MKSERVVSNPENHGWEEVNGKWIWEGTGSGVGAGMIVSETEPADKEEGLQWLNPSDGYHSFWDGEKWLEMPGGRDGAPGADGNIQDATLDGVIATWNNTDGRWTPEGNLSFDANGRMYLGNEKINSHFYSNGAIISRRDVGNHFQAEFSDGTEGYSGRHLIGAYNSDTGEYTVRIGTDGNATFSGTVTAGNGSVIGGNTFHNRQIYNEYFGLRLGGNQYPKALLPADSTGTATNGDLDLGTTSYRWNEGHFDGRVMSNGSQLTSTRDLIETLNTLREATKDESTLEGLRDAIGNAVGGLIEKFEAMQNEATTQEIQDD